MPWYYSQKTGELRYGKPDGDLVATGYSGCGDGLNNPQCEFIKNVGPIPRGTWRIGQAYDSNRVGNFALPLLPYDDVVTYQRTYFRIHGDNRYMNKSASNGCIILPRRVRELIANSGDNDLIVTA